MAFSNPVRHSVVLSTHPAKFNAVAFKGDFEANIAKISGWGYGGVELAVKDPALLPVDKLMRVLDEHRLKVPAIGTGQAWGEEGLSFTNPGKAIRGAATQRIKSQIQLAKQLQALVIIGLIRGITPSDQSKAQSMVYLRDCLQECADFASAHGVRLAIEPINRYETDLVNSVDEGLELISQVGSRSIGLLLDTFHMNIEEASIEASIRACGEHIFHFHVADSNRQYPGAGHINFKSILTALDSAGYTGWISGEFMPYPDADTAAQRSLEFFKNL